MRDIGHRPRRKDRQGIVHVAYSWGERFFEPMCECYTVQTRRETDEPPGTPITCIYCWYMIWNKGAKAQGET
jgi:hypothetical protein